MSENFDVENYILTRPLKMIIFLTINLDSIPIWDSVQVRPAQQIYVRPVQDLFGLILCMIDLGSCGHRVFGF